jgi:hypothetical protein
MLPLLLLLLRCPTYSGLLGIASIQCCTRPLQALTAACCATPPQRTIATAARSTVECCHAFTRAWPASWYVLHQRHACGGAALASVLMQRQAAATCCIKYMPYAGPVLARILLLLLLSRACAIGALVGWGLHSAAGQLVCCVAATPAATSAAAGAGGRHGCFTVKHSLRMRMLVCSASHVQACKHTL